MEARPQWQAVDTIVSLLEELTETAVLHVERATVMRKVQGLVGSFSLISCKAVMEVAVDFGHNYDHLEDLNLMALKSRPVSAFEKDVNSGGVRFVNRSPEQQSTDTKTRKSLQKAAVSQPIGKKKHDRVSFRKKTQLIELKEQEEEEDAVIEKFRKRKLLEEESRLQDEQEASQRNMATCITEESVMQDGKPSKFAASLRFTYDYDGSKIARKQQLPRKGLQALPNIEYREIDRQLPKQSIRILSKKDLLEKSVEANSPANQPADSLDPKMLQQFLEKLELEEGVNLKGCSVEMALPAAKNSNQNSSRKHLQVHPQKSSRNVDQNLLTTESEVRGTRTSKVSDGRNSMIIAEGWRAAIEQQFKIGSLKKMNIMGDCQQNRTDSTRLHTPLDPVHNYDLSILRSHNWGYSINQSRNKTNVPTKPEHASVHSPALRITRQRHHKVTQSSIQNNFYRSLRSDVRQFG